MKEEEIKSKLINFNTYEEIMNDVCAEKFLDIDIYNTRYLLHLFIKDSDLQTIFIEDEIKYIQYFKKTLISNYGFYLNRY